MTQHLKPYEAAARILCSMDGVDPDEEIKIPSVIAGAFTTEPVWHQAAEALVNLSKMLTALRMAAQQPVSAANDSGAPTGAGTVQ